jgi:hypothetical protein
LLALIGVAFLSALVTSTNTSVMTDVKQTARNIAEMQMEHIKSLDTYQETYSFASGYPGYSTEILASDARDMNLQRIEITVNYEEKPIFSMVGYKKY